MDLGFITLRVWMYCRPGSSLNHTLLGFYGGFLM